MPKFEWRKNDELLISESLRFGLLDMSPSSVDLRNLRPILSKFLRASVPLRRFRYRDDSSFPVEHS
jgi:hypothetical protein